MKIFKDRKNIILLVLILVIFIMGYGYSTLLQFLSIRGSAEINNNSTWQVEIVGIKDKSILGNAKVLESPSYTKTTANFSSEFYHKGDSIVYEITVENKGGLDAKLAMINMTPEASNDSVFTYQIMNVTPGVTLLKAGEKNTIDISVTYSNPEKLTIQNLKENMSVILNYVQTQ